MHLFFKFILIFGCCLTFAFCQFSLASLPKSRHPNKEPRINSPNTIIQIKVGPKSSFSNQPISSLSTNSSKPSDLTQSLPKNDLNQAESIVDPVSVPNNEATTSNTNPKESSVSNNETPDSNESLNNRSPKFGFGNLANKLTPKFPNTVSSIGSNLQSFSNKFKPNLPSLDDQTKPNFPSFGDTNVKPNLPFEIPKDLSNFANETANTFKRLPIVSEFLKIPNYFKINSLKGAIDYMLKYGHLESPIDLTKPEQLTNLSSAFKTFQDFFGLKQTGNDK